MRHNGRQQLRRDSQIIIVLIIVMILPNSNPVSAVSLFNAYMTKHTQTKHTHAHTLTHVSSLNHHVRNSHSGHHPEPLCSHLVTFT